MGRFVDDLVENLGYQHTMIGRARLENVAACLESIRRAGVPGDLIECGVWRGGTTVFMRGLLKAFGIVDRRAREARLKTAQGAASDDG